MSDNVIFELADDFFVKVMDSAFAQADPTAGLEPVTIEKVQAALRDFEDSKTVIITPNVEWKNRILDQMREDRLDHLFRVMTSPFVPEDRVYILNSPRSTGPRSRRPEIPQIRIVPD